jgi:hypothetical protein
MSEAGLALDADDGFTKAESEALGAEAQRARRHDRELSDKLGGPDPSGRVASSDYLRELGRRPHLPAALEAQPETLKPKRVEIVSGKEENARQLEGATA